MKWTEHQRFFSPKTENYKDYENPEVSNNLKNSPLIERKKKAGIEENNEEERKISLDLFSDEMTLREFLRTKSSRIWQNVQESLDNRIKIQHLLIFLRVLY